MTLSTNNLSLTEVTWADLENIHHLESIFEVNEFNTIGLPKNIDESRQNIKPFIEAQEKRPQDKFAWIVKRIDNNTFIGLVGYHLSNDKFKIGEFFYKLLPEHWGKGYATEIARKMIEIGFDNFKLHRIEAGCAIENHKSVRVLEKCGMIREGINRKILPIRGKWVDSYMYSIIEEERINL